MKSTVRWTLSLVGVAILAASSTLGAQGRQVEFRLDFASLQTADGNTQINLGFPGTFAVAVYMNDKVAIEPRVSFQQTSGDGFSGGIIGLGAFVPIHVSDVKSGVFVAPGVTLSKGTGDLDFDAVVDFGADVGIKRVMRDRISMRLAALVRTGDTYENAAGDTKIAFGASGGISLFWR